MGYQHIQVPETGERITVNDDHSLNVPDNPVIQPVMQTIVNRIWQIAKWEGQARFNKRLIAADIIRLPFQTQC